MRACVRECVCFRRRVEDRDRDVVATDGVLNAWSNSADVRSHFWRMIRSHGCVLQSQTKDGT